MKPVLLLSFLLCSGCGPSLVTLDGTGFDPLQPKLDGSYFGFWRTVDLDHSSDARPLPFASRNVKWLHLRFFGGQFDPGLDFRFADFEQQAAAWDALAEDRLLIDMADLDNGGVPFVDVPYKRGLHKANVDQAGGCAGATLCIHSPQSDCPLAQHRECINGRVVWKQEIGIGRHARPAMDTVGVPRRPLELLPGSAQDWEINFSRLDEEPGGRIAGEMVLSLERGELQEGDILRGTWRFQFEMPVISETLARCNESHGYGMQSARFGQSECSAP